MMEPEKFDKILDSLARFSKKIRDLSLGHFDDVVVVLAIPDLVFYLHDIPGEMMDYLLDFYSEKKQDFTFFPEGEKAALDIVMKIRPIGISWAAFPEDCDVMEVCKQSCIEFNQRLQDDERLSPYIRDIREINVENDEEDDDTAFIPRPRMGRR